MIDIHCHILPEFDDGAETMEDAIAMARMAAADGITAIVATPHYWEDMWTPTPQEIRRVVGELQDCLDDEGIPVKLLPGEEVMMDIEVPRLLRKGHVVTVGDLGEHLLIELPELDIPLCTQDVVRRIISMGVTPIIAHPEKNAKVRREPEMLQALVQEGCLVQIDADSLGASMWSSSRRFAAHLLNAGLAHVVASDGHSPKARPPVLGPHLRKASRFASPRVLERLAVETPASILRPAKVTVKSTSPIT
jgi:protein-tyrosine phosphatase